MAISRRFQHGASEAIGPSTSCQLCYLRPKPNKGGGVTERKSQPSWGGQAAAPKRLAQLPRAYGKYQLVSRLGSGGMAEVYRATLSGALGFEKQLVIKRLHPRFAADPRFVQLFAEEAKLAACVQHRNVVQIYELGDHAADTPSGRELYMALEYIEGADLKALLREAHQKDLRLPPWLAVLVGSEILEALIYAHDLRDAEGRRRNIVHCDVSPENIFLSSAGAAKLGDFGVACDDARSSDPFEGKIRGKLSYMSPEQARGEALTQASDIFSLGVVLWETIAQQRLFKAKTPAGTLALLMNGVRQPASMGRGDVPYELEQWVLAALRPNAKDRPSGRQLRDGLRKLLHSMLAENPLNALSRLMMDIQGYEPEHLMPFGLARLSDTKSEQGEATMAIFMDYLSGDLSTPVGPAAGAIDRPWAEAVSGDLEGFGLLAGQSPPVRRTRRDIWNRSSRRAASPMTGTHAADFPEILPVTDGEDPSSETATLVPSRSVSQSGALGGQAAPISAPISAPASLHETADILKRRPSREAHVAAPHRDLMSGSTPPQVGLLWIRQGHELRHLSLRAAFDRLAALQSEAQQARVEVSADGKRWLPFGHMARVLGERLPREAPASAIIQGELQDGRLQEAATQLGHHRANGRLVVVSKLSEEIVDLQLVNGRFQDFGASRLLFAVWRRLLSDATIDQSLIASWLHRMILDEEPLEAVLPKPWLARVQAIKQELLVGKLREAYRWQQGSFAFDPIATKSSQPQSARGSLLEQALSAGIAKTKLTARIGERLHQPMVRDAAFDRHIQEIAPSSTLAACFGDGKLLSRSIAEAGGEKEAWVLAVLLLELGLLKPEAHAL